MNNRLKQIIFDKLYQDLRHVEIIPYENTLWFIDRKEKYWYFEYEKSGELWWRWQFFVNFFELFSMEVDDFEPLISEWVEEVLNCKVNTPNSIYWQACTTVEEVLNCKVNTPIEIKGELFDTVEEVLNCKVNTPKFTRFISSFLVEEVLNCRVNTPSSKASHHIPYLRWKCIKS